jgi:hypothetical protein
VRRRGARRPPRSNTPSGRSRPPPARPGRHPLPACSLEGLIALQSAERLQAASGHPGRGPPLEATGAPVCVCSELPLGWRPRAHPCAYVASCPSDTSSRTPVAAPLHGILAAGPLGPQGHRSAAISGLSLLLRWGRHDPAVDVWDAAATRHGTASPCWSSGTGEHRPLLTVAHMALRTRRRARRTVCCLDRPRQ